MIMENISLITFLKATGGLGIFLLGMIVMTEGLHTLAGDSMRNALMRFTKSPVTGATTGAVVTAILQSSSAITVAAIGFVGAGLMAFPEALGIIFGANIGTTITGWMVALLGFKLNLGTAVLPIILIGVLLKLFTKDKLASFGYSIAGFGLIFVGITLLQEGMSGLEGIITPENLPSDSLIGRIKLLLLGILATIITQSSSAGVAATLTALFTHAINFEQAAALVIGMDVGTTVTAAMASIGGSVNVKRTGFSHVIYNFFTGTMAFFLITPYISIWENLTGSTVIDNAEIALVAFHTFFNTIGVIIILPFTHYFARFMEKIIPSDESKYVSKLDKGLIAEPQLALNALRMQIEETYIVLLKNINYLLGDKIYGEKADLIVLQKVLNDIKEYIDLIDLKEEKGAKWKELIAFIHIIDHMQRIYDRCSEDAYRAKIVQDSLELERIHHLLTGNNAKIISALSEKRIAKAKKYAQTSEKQINDFLPTYRDRVTNEMAQDKITMQTGTGKLEAIRWLVRVSHHISRIMEHLQEAFIETAK